MKKGNTRLLIFVLILFGLALWVVLPNHEILGRKEFRLGLDLKGGSHLVYSIDLSKKDPGQTDAEVIEGVKQKIERRVNAYGVTEPIIQTIRSDQGSFILVQLPGVKDIDEALKLIGQVAELDFREQVVVGGNTTWVVAKAVGILGSAVIDGRAVLEALQEVAIALGGALWPKGCARIAVGQRCGNQLKRSRWLDVIAPRCSSGPLGGGKSPPGQRR